MARRRYASRYRSAPSGCLEVAVRLGLTGAVPAAVPRSPVLVHLGAEGEEQRHAEGSGGVGPGRQLPVEVTRGDPFERVPRFGAARAPAGHVGGRRRQERDVWHGAVAPDRQHPLPREGQAAGPGLRERDPGEPAPDALLEGRELGRRRDPLRRDRRPTRAGGPCRTWQPTRPERARRSTPRSRRMPPARRRRAWRSSPTREQRYCETTAPTGGAVTAADLAPGSTRRSPAAATICSISSMR